MMKYFLTTVMTAALLGCGHNTPSETGSQKEAQMELKSVNTLANETVINFETRNGQTTEALQGYLMVPENRSDPESRLIRLNYVRFTATGATSGAPIIYLSGGPGGSGIGTAKGPRFPLFMTMREFGDVIAFDQRGTGEGSDLPRCESSQFDPDETPISDAEFVKRHKLAATECMAFWKAQGVDIFGYTTQESAKDLESLRVHLGAEDISLWGISYGSHLALATIKEMEGRIDRVVLAAVEGLAQTAKYPARTDAYLGRLQTAINRDENLRSELPDVKAMIKRVHAKLELNPIMLQLTTRDGSAAPYLLERRDMQQLASGLISDPQYALLGMKVYKQIDEGDVSSITALLSRFVAPNAPITFSPMTFAMDVASGVGPQRRAEISEQAKTALFADYLNFPMPQLDNYIPALDLGEAFREAPVSDVPVLALSGTLDGRTYPESHKEALQGFSQLEFVTIENAGHNSFMVSPEVTKRIQSFMRGETSNIDKITIGLPLPPTLEEAFR